MSDGKNLVRADYRKNKIAETIIPKGFELAGWRKTSATLHGSAMSSKRTSAALHGSALAKCGTLKSI